MTTIIWALVGGLLSLPICWYITGVMWERRRADMDMMSAEHNIRMVSHYGTMADPGRARYRAASAAAVERKRRAWRTPLTRRPTA